MRFSAGTLPLITPTLPILLLMGCGILSGNSSDQQDPREPSSPVSGSNRVVYTGSLDADGNASVQIPEITLDNSMPLVQGWLFTDRGVPGFFHGGYKITGDGELRFAAGPTYAFADYQVVVTDARRTVTGTLDASGNTTLSVPEINLDDMPLIAGYLYDELVGPAGYYSRGNLVTADGAFSIFGGQSAANAPFIVVIADADDSVSGALDAEGSATLAIPDLDPDELRATTSWVYYEEHGGYGTGEHLVTTAGDLMLVRGSQRTGKPYVVSWSP